MVVLGLVQHLLVHLQLLLLLHNHLTLGLELAIQLLLLLLQVLQLLLVGRHLLFLFRYYTKGLLGHALQLIPQFADLIGFVFEQSEQVDV